MGTLTCDKAFLAVAQGRECDWNKAWNALRDEYTVSFLDGILCNHAELQSSYHLSAKERIVHLSEALSYMLERGDVDVAWYECLQHLSTVIFFRSVCVNNSVVFTDVLSGKYSDAVVNLTDFMSDRENIETYRFSHACCQSPEYPLYIPKSLGLMFRDITSLSLIECKLKEIPKTILQWKLDYLCLNVNSITMLPSWLDQLPLEELHVESNGLKQVPRVITRLFLLRVLNLNENCISELPVELRALPLEEIHVKSNLLKGFPDILTEISTLREIHIS